MADYDIGAAFAEIEDELISSMIRNLKRHKAEETEEGFQWSQWQVEQLKALEEYRKNNQSKFSSEFQKINEKIPRILQQYYSGGGTEQEAKILENISKGGTETSGFSGETSVTGEFFKTNDRKLDSLIKSVTGDMERAETAVLRMADDQYRKTIFNAQVYANTGAGTYEKAVDMAIKDFLSAGINCIEYKNGRRVNIRSYADMAIRTASKRAYLQGEGAMRKQWGIHTVILNKRGNPCPLCAPFVGKVFIDDVWSGGTKEESEKTGYPLLSDAIAAGLYHPNCRDAHTTYFEDDDTLDEDEEDKEEEEDDSGEQPSEAEKETSQTDKSPVTDGALTKEEQRRNVEIYNAEQKQQYAQRQAERMTRMSKYSLDADNKRIYGSRAEKWNDKSEELKETVEKLKELYSVSESSKPKIENPNTVVDMNAINSSKYRRRITALGESNQTSREIFHKIRDILKHRTGTEYEDLVFIDSATGKSVSQTDYNVKRQCVPSKNMIKMVNEAEPYTIVAIHNHPNNSVPSLSDIVSAKNKKYKYGIIACHNGDIYKYTVLGEFNESIVDSLLDTVNKLIYNRNIIKDYSNLLSRSLEQLRENNINLEVLL